jgi:hypothetical protein
VIGCDSDVRHSAINHPFDGIDHAANRPHFPASVVFKGWHGEKMPEQFIGAVDQVNIHPPILAWLMISHLRAGKFEIGRFLHLKSEIRNFELDAGRQAPAVQFKFSDFGFEMQESSNFEIFAKVYHVATHR